MAECSLQESCCLDGCPLFCIRDVHLTDGGMCTDFSGKQMRFSQVEEEVLFACDEESVLQMSELGLPTCFATRSNGKGYRQQRKSKKSNRRKSHASLDDDQVITSLDGGFSEGLCFTVNESSVLRSVQVPSIGRGQVSKEGAIAALVLNEFAARVSDGGETIYHQEVADKGARAVTGESSEQLNVVGFTNHPSVERCSASNGDASNSQMAFNEEAAVSSCGAMLATNQGARVLRDGAVTTAPNEGGRISIGGVTAAKKGAMVTNGGMMDADEGAWVSSGRAINTHEGARVSSSGTMAACEGYRVSNNEAMPVAADEEATPLNGSTCEVDKGARVSKQETMAADVASRVSNYEGIGPDEGVSVSNHKPRVSDEGARISAHEEMVERARISSQEMQAEEASFLDPEVTVLLPWMPCWDDYYSRYFFYNRETFESTWEPPEGFERYAYAFAMESSTALQEGAEYYSGGNLNDGRNLVSNTIVVKETVDGGDSVDNDCKLDGFIHVSLGLDAVPGSKETLGNGEHLDCSQGKLDDGKDIESGYSLQKQAAVEGNGETADEDASPVCEEATHRKNDSFDSIVRVKVATCNDPVPKRRIKKASSLLSRLDCQHTDINRAMIDHNPSVFKYWIQRFHLFSKFNAGVKLDEEGWFSVTPEAIARHQAARCNHGVVVDAFTGVGGNAIQFALAGHYVVAIDNDPRKIEYAHHNALVYGVADLIDFIVGDFFAVSSSLQADVVFLSPPWGGPEYMDFKIYDIQTMLQPRDGISLFKVAQAVAPNIVFFLPRNVNMSQLAELSKTSKPPCSCEVERNFLNGKLKAVTAYFGEFACVEVTI